MLAMPCKCLLYKVAGKLNYKFSCDITFLLGKKCVQFITQ
jgi:hypothetical protein